MISVTEWAQRWNIPAAALDDLCRSCVYTPTDEPVGEASEAKVASEMRLEAARADVYLYRNQNGAGRLDSGNWVRFGLGNESPKLNKVMKSGDWIGIRKRLITAADVGRHVGQLVSREVKRENWKFSGTVEEQAQMRWATLINLQGGDAQIVTGPGSFRSIPPLTV